MSDTAGQMLLQIFLIGLNAFFACAEIAIISINDNKLARLAATGDKKAQRLQKLTEQPASFLATIQIGITLAGFLGSAFAADNFADKLMEFILGLGITMSRATLRPICVILITIILSYFTLVFGELVPKRVAMKKADSLALALSGIIYGISRIFSPIVWFLTKSTNALLILLGIDPEDEENEVTEEEIRMMIDVGSEKGSIDLDEKFLIHNVFEFDNKTADEVMTHRTDVVVLWLEDDNIEWEKTILASRHSIYPICSETTDNVVGILKIKDYLMLKDKSRDNVMKLAVKPVQFVPETVRTDLLFRNMKQNRDHFAIVLDEYGGMNGVITINDLLEQLVGELEDDNTAPLLPPIIEKLDENLWQINGSVPIEQVAITLGVTLPIEDYETFSGMVFGILGSIPDDGETPELFEFGLAIKILEIKDHKLEKAVVGVIEKENNKKENNKKENNKKENNKKEQARKKE